MPSCSISVCGVGDSHQGRGVAALNLLSDLKDQCGWTVEQPKQRKDLPSTGPQVNFPLVDSASELAASQLAASHLHHLQRPAEGAHIPRTSSVLHNSAA